MALDSGPRAGAQLRPGSDLADAPSSWRSAVGWDAAVVTAVVVVALVASVLVPDFAAVRNLGFLLLDVIAIALVALPMTLIIITGEIDLSVASIMGLTGTVMGTMWNHNVSIQMIIPAVIVLGAVLGAVNGFFVTVLGLPSLAVTIGTLALYRGLAYVVLGDTAVANWPSQYTTIASTTMGGSGIPYWTIPLVVLAVAFGVLLHYTPFGRSLYAIGYNPEAAAFSGIRVGLSKFWLYVMSGAVSGLAGVYWVLRYSSARADNATGQELAVVAAVLLGGVSIFGGRGNLPGVLAGVLLLATVRNALQLANVSSDALTVVTGLMLIASVLGPNIWARIRLLLSRRRAGLTTRPSL